MRRAIALCLLLGVGCGRSYRTRGVVLRVDEPGATLTVSHEAIRGFMDAMAMPFSVRHGRELSGLAPGDRVRFRLVVRGGRSEIDQLRVISAERADAGLLESPVAPTLVPVGSPFPDFELVDQGERRVSLGSLRGQVVAVNFIYTRCPLPDYCPRMVNHFKSVKEKFGDRLGKDLTLLTITFDPRYDTSSMLEAYAAAFQVGGEGWHFLTGTVDQIERVSAAFGVEFWPEEGLITHSLQTAVIDREGRLAATIEGKDFSEKQLADLLTTVLER